MTDAPKRIWIDGGPSPDNEWFAEPASGHDEVEYIRADLVPQPPQEPTPEDVERAAKAIVSAYVPAATVGYMSGSQAKKLALAALRAALTAPA